MKQSAIRRVSILLVAVLLIVSLPCVATAANNPLISVHAYSDADEQHHLLTLLELDEKAYISADDALAMSGYKKYDEQVGKITFEYGKHEVMFKDEQKEYGETFYYPLRELMDALSTRYYYEETSDTLIFLSCSSYYENLLADCKVIFSDGYDLDFYEGTGWQVAGIYEILGGLRFDAIWGGYQQELYEEAISGIIAEDDTSVLSTIKQGDSIMSKLSKMLKFTEKDINGVETYAEFLGTDIDGIIEAYSLLNGFIPGISIKNAIEIMEYVEQSSTSMGVFPNAVKYGLVNNENIFDINLIAATGRVYAYFDDNRPTAEAILLSLGEDAAKDSLDEVSVELLKELVGSANGGIYINAAYVKLAKMIFDELGMKERSSAVMQTVACRNIQLAAENQFINGQSLSSYVTMDSYAAKGERAKTVKYATILYLRACQYAYSLYEFDDTLSFSTDYWSSKTSDAISKISAYSDDELSMTVINDELDLSTVRCYEYDEQYVFIPATLYLKYASSWTTREEYYPRVMFKNDNTCSVRFNMLEFVYDMDGTYEVLLSNDGTKIIKVDMGTSNFGDGKTHNSSIFYLVETDNAWTYWGESIGTTGSYGKTFEAVDENIILTKGTMLEATLNLVEGAYKPVGGLRADWALDNFNFDSVDGKNITFDVEWYRTAGMYDVECQLLGNIGFFYYAEYMIDDYDHNEPFYETYGMLEVENDKVYLTLFETHLPYTEIGTYIYEKAKQADIINTLDDGEYQVNIYPNSIIDGKTLSCALLSYVEVSDEVISTIEIGDTIHLQDGGSFIVESIDRYFYDEGKEIFFNEGLERCCYIEETDSWRFAAPSDVAYTYVVDSLALPLADDVAYIDCRTAVGIGHNVYGVAYNGETNQNDSIFRLNSLSDYFDFYSGEYEQATITIENGEITQVIIYYRP